MTLFVDQAVLRSESTRLAAMASELDGVAQEMPASVDGGVGTPAILGILAALADDSGRLVAALAGSSDALGECVRLYAEQDAAGAHEIDASNWVE